MTQFDKGEILQQMTTQLEAQLKVLVEAAFEAKEASTNEESKAENKYDTRGLEASYLASGQAQRAQKLQEQIYILSKLEIQNFHPSDSVRLGALVELETDSGERKIFFVLPIGGVETFVDNFKIQSVTLESPLGQSLVGRTFGAEFALNNKTYQVTGVL